MGLAYSVNGLRIMQGGRELVLRGVNLGCWLNIECFMVGLAGTDWQIRRAVERQFGPDAAHHFFAAFHDSFVTRSDIERIVELGFNCVRVPFNYRYFESDQAPFVYRDESFVYLDRVFDWCDELGVMVVLDMHAAPGGQNTTHPSDNVTGYAQLWSSVHYQDRTVALWEAMAKRYRKRPSLIGYNLLNEPITSDPAQVDRREQIDGMNRLNLRLINALDALDSEHLIIIEGEVRPCGGFNSLDRALFEHPRTVLSYHHYPLSSFEHSTNYEHNQTDSCDPAVLTKFIEQQISPELELAHTLGRPLLLGEFACSRPASTPAQRAIIDAQLACAQEQGIHWLLWSWKDVGKMGLVTPRTDLPWVQFVNDPHRRAIAQECDKTRAVHFDQYYVNSFGKNQSNRYIYDAAWNDELRGMGRLLLEYEMRQLAERFDPAVLGELPRCFRLENCVLNQVGYDGLKPYLAL